MFWCVDKSRTKYTNSLDVFFPATEVFIFDKSCSKAADSKTGLHIFVYFFPGPTVLLHQRASFMLLYGLYSILDKCIYPAMGKTAPSCFILTWTLNLSLYIVCIRLNFGLRFLPPVLCDGEYKTGKLSRHSCEYILLPALSLSIPCVGWPLTSSENLTGA